LRARTGRRVGWTTFIAPVAYLVFSAGLRAQVPSFADPSTPLETRITSLIASMTLEEKIAALGTNPSIPRLGIKLSGHIEGLHGVALGGPGQWGRFTAADGTRRNEPVPTTQFPQAAGLGATWDVEVLKRVATLEGEEARYAFQDPKYHRGGLVVRAPNADLARDPRWGRSEESYGEDPFLVGTLATAFVRGLQGEDPTYWRAAALLKHFMANSNEDGRDRSSSDFDQRLMREYYSVPFRMAIVDGGARAYMASYNAWNGIPMAVNPTLRAMTVAEWHENGIICTDGGAMTQLVTTHARFATLSEAAAAAVHAGINQFLDQYRPAVEEALRQHQLAESDIDAALRGVYRVMFHLGLLDPAQRVPYSALQGGEEPWLSEEHRAAARWATDKSIVLLKNERSTLPLNPRALKSVAVIGPYADQVLLDWYSGTPPYGVSPLEGIRRALQSSTEVSFAPDDTDGKAVRLAKSADLAVVVIGNHPTCNAGWNQCPIPSDGKEAIDRKSLTLEQESLLQKIFAVNPHTVVVLVSSFPYTINWSQAHVPAILLMTHNSQEMGNALADVLFGKFNPAGRLTETWPQTLEQLPPMLDYDIRHGRTYMYFRGKPLYAFGYGLSYTQFRYSQLRSVATAEGAIDVTFTLTNAGTRDGEEVAQLYAQFPHSALPRPSLALKSFQRVSLKSGESKILHMRLAPRDFAVWDDIQHCFTVEAGAVKLLIGASSTDIRLSQVTHVLKAQNLAPDLRDSIGAE
jgi:beta-glucosidase